MRFVSTRGGTEPASLSDAIARGLAPDGGLFVPDAFPEADLEALRTATTTAEVAVALLTPFFAGDRLEGELTAICREAFNFPSPLVDLPRDSAVLELFRGPTAAFKDFGARFLAATLSRLSDDSHISSADHPDRPVTILVATSGDTGGAVAAAFAGRPGFRVVVLYPKGMVSDRQERQLTCWGGNITALRVRGDFDACQRMVKEAFADESLREEYRLTSANSISLGRLLPQMVYYAQASLQYEQRHGTPAGFVIPSGNLGNATACYWARKMGLPIREIVLATNRNKTVTRFVEQGLWEPAPTVATLASAMDVGNPSNMERLFSLHGGQSGARNAIRAVLVDDDTIRETIRRGPSEWGQVWDPHTATAVTVREAIPSPHWVIVSTAHPAKFEAIVEPLIGRELPVPSALAELLDREMDFQEVDAKLDSLAAVLT
ncbi:MAG: threonine synthase [Gemmatimonadota bacterium]|jgi:threonine synthase|nr:threonine synthase [Gemmatimonadota bacterium]